MKLLKTINNQDIFPELNQDPQIEYWNREASRAIVFDNEDKIAILHVTKKNYHKLPGGGIEEGEDIETALKREAIEEIGCDISVTDEVGQIDEYRAEHKLLQKNYCFLATVVGDKGTPQFVDDEIKDGFVLKWMPLDEAIATIKNDRPDNCSGKFIVYRDIIFLEAGKKLLRTNDKENI
jgi:8-oxo-dGTP pyrophosphatase MutT (NUDIX family)